MDRLGGAEGGVDWCKDCLFEGMDEWMGCWGKGGEGGGCKKTEAQER